MEFEFDPNIDYQLEAINSITDIFQGQKNTYEDRPFIAQNGVIPNQMHLSEEDILTNLKGIQERNDIEDLTEELDSLDFSVEMETGTGKTYVYLRTIMELYEKYGRQKYIIVVPSVAIREGVIKSLQMTENHFQKLYDNISYNFFEYDSSDLQKVREFSRNNSIEIMVITLQAFNKWEDNIMFQYQDTLNGNRPIDFIKQTRPILILDEPQNMESENSQEAIAELNPLFTLRYSATHRNTYNLVYQLTPYDAYQRGVVKQIDVLSVVKEHDFNTRLIQVDEIESGRELKARLTIHKNLKNGIKEGRTTVRLNDNIYKKSKGIDNYEGLKVTNINASEGFVEFNDGTKVYEGESTDPDIEKIQRLQIRETIKEHFEKALELYEQGLKVLSLFFIDRVSHYTDDDGHLRMAFEEEFNKLKQQEPYKEIYGDKNPSEVMGSYFSEYKSENNIQEDTEAYELIMQDKEKLLSLEEPVEFIFSHSALKEGWDNPNVFNICTLNNTVSRVKKRQEIGRGVRLPVNQEGERIQNENINILTVAANESYADYVAQLQTEYEEETGYSDDVSDRVKEREERKVLEPKEEVKGDEDFKELWKRISKKTRYKTHIDTETLIEESVEELDKITVSEPQIEIHKVSVEAEEDEDQLDYRHRFGSVEDIDTGYDIPNVVRHLADETGLTRETIVEILSRSDSTDQMFKNPVEYLRRVSNRLERIKERHVIQEIEYVETNERFATAVFKELTTYSGKTVEVEKSIYEELILDSEGEKDFAWRLDREDEVIFFVKLHPDFKIPTPIGGYNPDWGIVYQKKNRNGSSEVKFYLVRETKFVEDLDRDLRPSESMKIECAKEHFETIDVSFSEITDVDESLLTEEQSKSI